LGLRIEDDLSARRWKICRLGIITLITVSFSGFSLVDRTRPVLREHFRANKSWKAWKMFSFFVDLGKPSRMRPYNHEASEMTDSHEEGVGWCSTVILDDKVFWVIAIAQMWDRFLPCSPHRTHGVCTPALHCAPLAPQITILPFPAVLSNRRL